MSIDNLSSKLIIITLCLFSAAISAQNSRQETVQHDSFENSCSLKVSYDAKNKVDSESNGEELNAYAGNGFNYDVGCHTNDAKIRPNDKYYVIDLVLYGPNSRVAKAWREQFNAYTLIKNSSLLLNLNKKVSFHWIGVNSLVCSITKYNNLVNKFTRICQKTIKINATEKFGAGSNSVESKPPLSYLDLLFLSRQMGQTREGNNKIDELQKLISDQKLAWYSNQTSTSTVPQGAVNDDLDYEVGSNETAMAMQFRNEKNSLSNNKNLITIDSASNNTENSSRSNSDKVHNNIMQPLLIILVFLIIFSISIGTIAYLTYHQKSGADDYSSVKQNDDVEDQRTVSDLSQTNSMSRKFNLVHSPGGSAVTATIPANTATLCSTSQISSTCSGSDCNETNKMNSSNDEEDVNEFLNRK